MLCERLMVTADRANMIQEAISPVYIMVLPPHPSINLEKCPNVCQNILK